MTDPETFRLVGVVVVCFLLVAYVAATIGGRR